MNLRILALFSALVFAVAGATSAQTFNEVRISSPGGSDDTSNFFEIFGNANESLDGLTVLAISAEFNPGLINNVFDLGGTSIGDDGFYLAGDATEYPGADLDIAGTDFFGSPTNFLLVEGFSGASVTDDLDSDDDGIIDGTFFTSIVDGLFMTDGDGDQVDVDYTGGLSSVGPDGTFTPAHVFRTVDGGGVWEIGEFGDTSGDTPGASNVAAIPEPAAGSILALIAFAGFCRRRR